MLSLHFVHDRIPRDDSFHHFSKVLLRKLHHADVKSCNKNTDTCYRTRIFSLDSTTINSFWQEMSWSMNHNIMKICFPQYSKWKLTWTGKRYQHIRRQSQKPLEWWLETGTEYQPSGVLVTPSHLCPGTDPRI